MKQADNDRQGNTRKRKPSAKLFNAELTRSLLPFELPLLGAALGEAFGAWLPTLRESVWTDLLVALCAPEVDESGILTSVPPLREKLRLSCSLTPRTLTVRDPQSASATISVRGSDSLSVRVEFRRIPQSVMMGLIKLGRPGVNQRFTSVLTSPVPT